jgi:hypothetical protein
MCSLYMYMSIIKCSEPEMLYIFWNWDIISIILQWNVIRWAYCQADIDINCPTSSTADWSDLV